MNKEAIESKEKRMTEILERIKIEGRTARELKDYFDMPISTVKTYLSYLKKDGLVKCLKKDGRRSVWSVSTPIEKKDIKNRPHRIALLANQAY